MHHSLRKSKSPLICSYKWAESIWKVPTHTRWSEITGSPREVAWQNCSFCPGSSRITVIRTHWRLAQSSWASKGMAWAGWHLWHRWQWLSKTDHCHVAMPRAYVFEIPRCDQNGFPSHWAKAWYMYDYLIVITCRNRTWRTHWGTCYPDASRLSHRACLKQLGLIDRHLA